MRILLTGHLGYIGTVMTPMLLRQDTRSSALIATFILVALLRRVARFPKCRRYARTRAMRWPATSTGIDAVIHLAALSNDPLGDLRYALTDDIIT